MAKDVRNPRSALLDQPGIVHQASALLSKSQTEDDTRLSPKQILSALHHRLSRGDDSARNAVAEYLMVHVPRIVLATTLKRDLTVINDAVEDAVMDYLAHPCGFVPGKSALLSFIVSAARRNVLDENRKESRRRTREDAWASRRCLIPEECPDKSDAIESRSTDISKIQPDLGDSQWCLVESLVRPTQKTIRGRARADQRAVVNAILWVLRHEGRWPEVPRRYPPYKTCHRYFLRWVRTGILKELLERLLVDIKRRGSPLRTARTVGSR